MSAHHRDEAPVRTRRAPCPKCDRGACDTALSISTFGDGREVAHCHRCGHNSVHQPHDPMRGTWRKDRDHAPVTAFSEAPRHARLSDYGRELWRSTEPVGDIARDYLLARNLVLPPVDSDLRWHRRLRHPIEHFEGPALVALVRDVVTAEPLSLHRTWINPDGTKHGNPPRMLLGGHRKAGGVIMLWPSAAVAEGLAIAEGIETALAVAHFFTPVWSCIDAGNLAAFPPLPGITSLLIVADHDEAGMRAAHACAARWAARDVEIQRPVVAGYDAADVYASKANPCTSQTSRK